MVDIKYVCEYVNAILNTPYPKRQSKHETGLIFPSSGAMQSIAIIRHKQFPSVHWKICTSSMNVPPPTLSWNTDQDNGMMAWGWQQLVELYCTFLLVLRNSMLQEEFDNARLLKNCRYLSRQESGIFLIRPLSGIPAICIEIQSTMGLLILLR